MARTLAEWSESTNTFVRFPWGADSPYHGCAVIADRITVDRDGPATARWDLFHLADYVVSSVTAGSIYLVPRNPTTTA